MAYNPPIGSIYQLYIYTTYILPSGGLYATYHPLQEPEKSIDFGGIKLDARMVVIILRIFFPQVAPL